MDAPPELHAADPRLRRLARWLPLAVLVGSALALLALHRWLATATAAHLPLDALLLGFVGLAVLLAGAGLALGRMLWLEAGRIIAEDRYPSSGMRTLRDVPVLRGDAARRPARWLQVAATAAGLLALALLGWGLLAVRMLA